MDGRLIFPFPSTKIAIFMDRIRQPKAVLSGRRELNYVKAVRIGIYLLFLVSVLLALTSDIYAKNNHSDYYTLSD